MLAKIVSSVGLLALLVNGQCDQAGQTPLRNTGTHNYVLDSFADSIPFPYAIGQCTSVSVLSTKYYKYTCDKNNANKWEVTKLEFSSSACSGTGSKVDSWVEGDSKHGDLGYFVCDAYNTYVKVDIAASVGCAGSVIVYAGLGACANYDTTQISTYCDATQAQMQFYVYYNNVTFCATATYCTKWNFGSSCAKVATANINGNAVDVYGKMDSCYSAVTTTTSAGTTGATTTTMKSSRRAQFAVLNIIFALIVSLVWLF